MNKFYYISSFNYDINYKKYLNRNTCDFKVPTVAVNRLVGYACTTKQATALYSKQIKNSIFNSSPNNIHKKSSWNRFTFTIRKKQQWLTIKPIVPHAMCIGNSVTNSADLQSFFPLAHRGEFLILVETYGKSNLNRWTKDIHNDQKQDFLNNLYREAMVRRWEQSIKNSRLCCLKMLKIPFDR